MTQFIQFHLLTAYPPANLNRDDLGRPKTAPFGGSTRLRISSQSLKRAWRTSDLFQSALSDHIGERTKLLGKRIYYQFIEAGIKEKDAKEWAKKIAGQFGKVKEVKKKKKNKKAAADDEGIEASQEENVDSLEELEIEQLAHINPEEKAAIDALVKTLIAEKRAPKKEELSLLRKTQSAADIALFGRMLAANPAYNMEASAQVAHAITVNSVAIEDDFFIAVDDLNQINETSGAAHMGNFGFGSGIFYLYVCVDRDLLLENLNQDVDLMNRTLKALAETMIKVAPIGKQNSFASRAYASYVLTEKGHQQPRSLVASFLNGIQRDLLPESIQALRQTKEKMDKVYGACSEAVYELNTLDGEGSFDALINFILE